MRISQIKFPFHQRGFCNLIVALATLLKYAYSSDTCFSKHFPTLPVYQYISVNNEVRWLGNGTGNVWPDLAFLLASMPFIPLEVPVALVSSPQPQRDTLEAAIYRCGLRHLGRDGIYTKKTNPANIILMDLFTLHPDEDVQEQVQAATNLRTLILPYLGIELFDWSRLPPKLENLHLYRIKLQPSDLAKILSNKHLRRLEMIDCNIGNTNPSYINNYFKSGKVDLQSCLRELTNYTGDMLLELAMRHYKYPNLQRWTCAVPLSSLRPNRDWDSYLPKLTELEVIYPNPNHWRSYLCPADSLKMAQKAVDRLVSKSFHGAITLIPHRMLGAAGWYDTIPIRYELK